MSEQMSENNVTKLADHIKSNAPVATFDLDELKAFSLKNEKIMLRRAFAFMCDFGLVIMVKNMVSASYALGVGEFLAPLTHAQKNALIRPGAVVEGAVFAVIFVAYFFYCHYVLDGKTPGCRLAKLNVVDEKFTYKRKHFEHHPNAAQSLKRSLGQLACYMSFGTFFFFSFLNEERRGLQDHFSDTRVVSEEWLKSHKAWKRDCAREARIDINSLDSAA